MKLRGSIVLYLLAVTVADAGQFPGQGNPRDFADGHVPGTECAEIFTDHPALTAEEYVIKKRFVADGSYYGNRLFHNRNRMASGNKLHECDGTVVAFNSLPLGTIVRITNPNNGKRALAVIQDRGGPHVTRRPDLSRGTYERLDEGPADGVLKKLIFEVLVPAPVDG